MPESAFFRSPSQEAKSLAKILIVDDRPENILALDAALRDPTYQLTHATSGRAAIQSVREEDYAVILLDVQMPIMDGFATARLIRKEARSRFTPIIFVTASNASDYHEQQGYEAGAVDYLFKPLNVTILKAKVAVFVDLFRKNQEIQKQAMLIYARDEFLSIASHELKTPITPLSLQMQSFIALIESGNFENVPREKIQRMLKNSFTQVERLTRLIDELLDVSRITAGRMTLSPEKVDLGELITIIVDGFYEEAKWAGCDLRLKIEENSVDQWDRLRIEQVVVNLISNALKYGGGKPVDVTVSSEGDLARIAVKDLGIGIAKEDQSRIFERFERAASSLHFGGLGLGLYIAREIVRLHQGKIQVESEPGAGATFTVELPKSATTGSTF